jgi:hypothetical protein
VVGLCGVDTDIVYGKGIWINESMILGKFLGVDGKICQFLMIFGEV